MINGHIEEPLDLIGMEVHRDDTIHTSGAQQIGHQLGANADTGLVLTILTRPSEIRDHGVDSAR